MERKESDVDDDTQLDQEDTTVVHAAAPEEDAADDNDADTGLETTHVFGKMINLKSREGDLFEIKDEYAAISKLVEETILGDPDATEIPLPNVASATLAKIVDYMNFHKGKEPEFKIDRPLKSKDMIQNCKVLQNEWDGNFCVGIMPERTLLYAMLKASNYMNIPGLLELMAASIASLIRGKKLEDVPAILDEDQSSVKRAATGNASQEEKKVQTEETALEQGSPKRQSMATADEVSSREENNPPSDEPVFRVEDVETKKE